MRQPLSQTALAQRLNLSKSHVSFLVKNLLDQGYLEREDSLSAEEEGGGTRRRQRLKVLSHGLYTAVLIHTLWEFSLSLYPLGSSFPSVTLNLERSRYAEVMADRIAAGLEEALSTLSLDKSALGLLLLATQASLELGYAGTVFRDNVLSDVNFPLAEYLRERLHLPVYVCNYAYAHVLCMYHSPNVRVSDALYFSCGEGSVALGIFIDGKIVMGPRNTFPECSHLPFPYGLEASMGNYGPHTARALTFAVGALAPVFKLRRVLLSGSCFEEHPEVIVSAQRALKESDNSLIRQTVLEYWPREIDHFREELIYLSFEELISLMKLRPLRRSLSALLPSSE